jgi:HPt (histidine-containing phosphotransfer) domain-containing protein
VGERTALRSELASDPLVAPLLAEFIVGMRKTADEIRSLLTAGNLNMICERVHQLKGTAGSYGYPQITQAAASVEADIVDNASIEQITVELDQFLNLIARVDMPTEPF